MLEESSNQRWIEFAALNAATRAMGPLVEGALKDGGGGLQGLQDPGALFLRAGEKLREIALRLEKWHPLSSLCLHLLRPGSGSCD